MSKGQWNSLCLLCRHSFLFQPSCCKNPFFFFFSGGNVRKYSRITICNRVGWAGPASVAWCPNSSIGDMVIYSAVCLATGPFPLPKRVLHRQRPNAPSFNFHYPVFSLRSYSSRLPLLPRLPVTYILPTIFPSITCFRRKFVRKMWPVQLAFFLQVAWYKPESKLLSRVQLLASHSFSFANLKIVTTLHWYKRSGKAFFAWLQNDNSFGRRQYQTFYFYRLFYFPAKVMFHKKLPRWQSLLC